MARTAKKKIRILDEGIQIVADADSLDFAGSGVAGTFSGNNVTETIPGTAISATTGQLLYNNAGVITGVPNSVVSAGGSIGLGGATAGGSYVFSTNGGAWLAKDSAAKFFFDAGVSNVIKLGYLSGQNGGAYIDFDASGFNVHGNTDFQSHALNNVTFLNFSGSGSNAITSVSEIIFDNNGGGILGFGDSQAYAGAVFDMNGGIVVGLDGIAFNTGGTISDDVSNPGDMTVGGNMRFNGQILSNNNHVNILEMQSQYGGDPEIRIALESGQQMVLQAQDVDGDSVTDLIWQGIDEAGTGYSGLFGFEAWNIAGLWFGTSSPSVPTYFAPGRVKTLMVDGSGLTFYDGYNIVAGTSTGTKFGTATSQKIAFYNSTPIVQPGATTDLGTVLSNLGLRAAGTAYPITTSGAVQFANLALTGKITTYNNVATAGYGVPAIVDSRSLTNQSADITTTNFTNAGTAGLYRVSYMLADTTSDLTAGAVTLTIAYTDAAGATTATANQVLTGVGRVSGSVYIQLASGSISYATAHTGIFGSAKYALYLTAERLN